jgi:hypothetical protein
MKWLSLLPQGFLSKEVTVSPLNLEETGSIPALSQRRLLTDDPRRANRSKLNLKLLAFLNYIFCSNILVSGATTFGKMALSITHKSKKITIGTA